MVDSPCAFVRAWRARDESVIAALCRERVDVCCGSGGSDGSRSREPTNDEEPARISSEHVVAAAGRERCCFGCQRRTQFGRVQFAVTIQATENPIPSLVEVVRGGFRASDVQRTDGLGFDRYDILLILQRSFDQ